MQFRPPSQPGWGSFEPEEPGQQPFPQQPSMYVPVPPQQQTGYPQWPQQPVYPSQPPYYPPQPQQWPPMQPVPPQKPRSAFKAGIGIGCGIMTALALVVVVIIVLVSAGSHSTYTPTAGSQTTPVVGQSTPDSSQPTSPPQPTTFNVGDTASNGTWSVTMNSVKMATSGIYASPAAGNIYLVVDVTTENLSSTPQLVSSEVSFTLKDTTGQVYSEAITGIGVAPDGTIQPGTKLRGQISYEVPKSLHDFTFQFQENAFGGSAAIWTFSV